MKKKLLEILATGFYFGRSPVVPGTMGTLWGIPIAYFLMRTNPLMFLTLSMLFILIAILVSELYEKQVETHDLPEIVIDEMAGFVVTMAYLPMTWQSFVAGFVLFRFFDMVKPFPISHFDKNVKGGFGVVLDDLVAGLMANVLLQLIDHNTTWLRL